MTDDVNPSALAKNVNSPQQQNNPRLDKLRDMGSYVHVTVDKRQQSLNFVVALPLIHLGGNDSDVIAVHVFQ